MRRDPVRLTVLLLLLATFAGPELVWAGVHALEHHHAEAAAPAHSATECEDAGPAFGALLHGHAHPDGVPRHNHELVSAPALRLDPAPVQTPAAGVPAVTAPAAPLPSMAVRAFRTVSPPGAGPPPLLQLLCTLLI